jgi:hypothetical protein
MNKKARSRKFTTKQSARLGAYFAAGVAASMTASSDADAAIVFFDVNPDRVVNSGDTFSFGNINLSNATYDSSATAPSFTFSNFFGNLSASGASIEFTTSDFGFYLEAYGFGDLISGALEWSNSGGYLASSTDVTRYIGLRLDSGGSNFNYGWASITGGALDSVIVNSFAFQGTPNTAILAGDQGGGPEPIPEPGTWAAAALLMGGATYLGWRRRRDAAQKQAA